MTRTDDRTTELEIALTHQAAMLEDLSAMVRVQADRLDRLERVLAALALRIAEDGPGAADPEASLRPPHW